MINTRSAFILFLIHIIFLPLSIAQVQRTDSLKLEGLIQEVEIKVDQWGIAHIYAQNEADLFFAQGYNAARDRLFQFEIWRRQATGTTAEILGQRALDRDIGTRLFMFRGDIEQEMNYYHPNGSSIIKSFVKGVNAYILMTRKHPELLPVEFKLLGILPGLWTPEIVISRHQGLLGNITREIGYLKMAKAMGPAKTQALINFHPNKPDLSIDPKLADVNWEEDILALYTAFRRPLRFLPSDLAVSSPSRQSNPEKWVFEELLADELNDIGSNNWVVSGKMTESGYPIMANDPHRTQAVPSLRYWAHLHAPGWNVLGGGEPEIPGISIGHNEYGAWGLTVFRTDAEDLYVYDLNPDNPFQYKYQGDWVDMKSITDTIKVKGGKEVFHTHYYSQHGPIVHISADSMHAFAVRAGWMEIGGSPYLASLRMDQADSWESFREACSYSHIPGENMIWADKEGNIAWQAVGIAPIRPNWSGLLPVPGDGTYEWAGYLPIKAKPHALNPENGFISTANQNVSPLDYEYPEALGYEWSDPYRGNRLKEILGSGRMHTLADMKRLQTDYLSIPARNLVPMLVKVQVEGSLNNAAMDVLKEWDYRLDPESIAAGIYNAFEHNLVREVSKRLIPQKSGSENLRLSMKLVLNALSLPSRSLGARPLHAREDILKTSFLSAVSGLRSKLGNDIDQWQYGQEKYKHIQLTHVLGNIAPEDLQPSLNLPPVPRGGNSHTVNNSGGNDRQSHGASFRIIVDLEDWDKCVGMNSPGQSGNPDDPHYGDLYEYWAKDQFFQVPFSEEKIEEITERVIRLLPE